mmetsp:Transcript_38371/g.50567  ORF Transcript_38371/g.50567 Transcript_38371/m.50567 type:complete len:217 (-) Transcript_38371:88-738(-)
MLQGIMFQDLCFRYLPHQCKLFHVVGAIDFKKHLLCKVSNQFLVDALDCMFNYLKNRVLDKFIYNGPSILFCFFQSASFQKRVFFNFFLLLFIRGIFIRFPFLWVVLSPLSFLVVHRVAILICPIILSISTAIAIVVIPVIILLPIVCSRFIRLFFSCSWRFFKDFSILWHQIRRKDCVSRKKHSLIHIFIVSRVVFLTDQNKMWNLMFCLFLLSP